jgi:hypothetical protein
MPKTLKFATSFSSQNNPSKIFFQDVKYLEGVFVSLEEFNCRKCDFRSTSRPLFYCPTHKLQCQVTHTMKPKTPNKFRTRNRSESEVPIRHIESLTDQVNELIISTNNTELCQGTSKQSLKENLKLRGSSIESCRRPEEKVKRNLNFELSSTQTQIQKSSEKRSYARVVNSDCNLSEDKECKKLTKSVPKKASSFCQICSREVSISSSFIVI